MDGTHILVHFPPPPRSDKEIGQVTALPYQYHIAFRDGMFPIMKGVSLNKNEVVVVTKQMENIELKF